MRFDSRQCQTAALRKPKPILSSIRGISHYVIPDNQVKPGVPIDHLYWIGMYIAEKSRPGDLVINLGDFWDMPSLSSYDKGKKAMEGRRYIKDVAAGNKGMALLSEQFSKSDVRRILLRGNHEDRIDRAVNSDASLDGLLSMDQLESPGWEVIPFNKPIDLNGISYVHYFYNPMTGKALGGSALTRLAKLGHSFTQGHQQILDYALRFPQTMGGRSQHGLIAGSCYLHEEDYLGPQGNDSWMGIVVCHNVENGSYDPKFVSLDSLCRRYTGQRLADYQPKLFA
jgi:hypothetical protein